MGHFQVKGVNIGLYRITASAEGYTPWSDIIEVFQDQTTYLNITIGQAELSMFPEELNIELFIDSELDTTVNITNSGSGDACWSLGFASPEADPTPPWTLQARVNISEITGDNNIFGAAVINGMIFVSGANNNDNPNHLYIFDYSGNYLTLLEQPTLSSYGFRDLASDGSIIYGSENRWIAGINSEGEVIDSIFAPFSPNRGLTYDSDRDWFWCADNRTDIAAVDRDGIERARIQQPLHIYGLGYFPYDPDGMPLYIFSQDGEIGEPLTTISKVNPDNGNIIIETCLEQENKHTALMGGDISAGLTGMTDRWRCPLIVADTLAGESWLEIYTLADAVPWLAAQPVYGILPPAESTGIDIHFNAASLIAGWYNANINITYDGTDSPLETSVSLRVVSVSAAEIQAVESEYIIQTASPNPFNSYTSWLILLPRENNIRLEAYDLLGRKVDTMDYGLLKAGSQRVVWNVPSGLASGIYFINFQIGDVFVKMDKVVFVK